MTTNTTITLYRLTASYERDGHTLDCTQAEVLGDAWGRYYETQEDARNHADELAASVADCDLDPSTSYDVEPVTVVVSDIDAERDGGIVEVSARIRIDGGAVQVVTVYGEDAITGSGIHGLTPSGSDLGDWTDADILAALGKRTGAYVCREILGMARTTATDAGLVVAP